MRSHLVFISSFLFVLFQLSNADSRVLRPCFERYANHRLVNVRPYHSEWRMKTEDMCLLFCAQSASRCRSVVYDTVQHICHYFSDEGVDQAVLAAKMTYLRVVSSSCLNDNVDVAADPNTLPPPDSPPVLLTSSSDFMQNEIQQELSIPQPPMDRAFMEPPTPIPSPPTIETTETIPEQQQTITFETITEQMETIPTTIETTTMSDINEEELDKELKEVMGTSQQFQGSFNEGETSNMENNGVYREQKTHEEHRWMDSMEKMSGNSKKTIDEKLEDMKTGDKKKYEILMGEQRETESVEDEKMKLKNNLRYGAKVIKFDEDAAFRKSSELRRKPVGTKRPELKPVTISSTSYIQKAKSFLDELNDSDEVLSAPQSTDNNDVITTECRSDDVAVWIAFENSEQSDESGNTDGSSVSSRTDCQQVCDQNNCRSFTYFETTKKCHLSMKSDGVSLEAPKQGDFTASSSTKFCYPSTFSVFDGCSNFVAFRDYSVRIPAVEEFDGLPRGYDGMQLCVELCVLSTSYTCKSSTFNPITGKCRLLTEDSMSSPDDFKYDEFQKDLYFENGCTSTQTESKEIKDRNVEIVAVKTKKTKRRSSKEKRLRRRKH